MIKNIIFDVGMVLADFRYKDYMKDLGFSEELQKIFCEKVIENPLWGELDLGVRDSEEVIREMKDRVSEYQAEADLFFEKINDIVLSHPYARAWIRDVRQRGYRVYLLSNYPKELFSLHSKEKFTFINDVDGKVVSGFVKLAKPDPEIYRLLLMTYDLQPEECVFIDDRADNVKTAENLGLKTILFQNYEQAKTDLENLLDKESGSVNAKGRLLPEDGGPTGMFHVDHYAISVSDMEKSKSFYEKLGFRAVKDYQAKDQSVRILQMDKDGFLLEMFCYPDSSRTPDFVETLNTDLHVNGAKHMALAVESPEKAAQYLLQAGLIREMPAINEGRLGRPYFFIKDPDGIFVEIITK